MRYKRLSSCIQTAFTNIKPFGRLLQRIDNTNDSYAVSVMNGMEVVGHAPCKIPKCVRF